MTENEETQDIGIGFLNSKFGRTLLVIISVVLIFAGPTYLVYALGIVLKVNLWASFAVGLVLFVIGLVMMRYLVKKNIIT